MTEKADDGYGLGSDELAAFRRDFQELLARHGVEVGVEINGDTQNLDCNFVVCKEGADRYHVLVKNYEMVGQHDLG